MRAAAGSSSGHRGRARARHAARPRSYVLRSSLWRAVPISCALILALSIHDTTIIEARRGFRYEVALYNYAVRDPRLTVDAHRYPLLGTHSRLFRIRARITRLSRTSIIVYERAIHASSQHAGRTLSRPIPCGTGARRLLVWRWLGWWGRAVVLELPSGLGVRRIQISRSARKGVPASPRVIARRTFPIAHERLAREGRSVTLGIALVLGFSSGSPMRQSSF